MPIEDGQHKPEVGRNYKVQNITATPREDGLVDVYGEIEGSLEFPIAIGCDINKVGQRPDWSNLDSLTPQQQTQAIKNQGRPTKGGGNPPTGVRGGRK